MHLLHLVGARPNFVKAAPVLRAFAKMGFEQTLVHTGAALRRLYVRSFFQHLQMPAPDVSLEVGSGSHAR